jgi:hypothetical protein
VSRYDLFRRRIAPIAFALALALIVRDSCQKDQRTHTSVELTFGAAASQVRGVEVDVVAGGETIATFRRAAPSDGAIGPCRFPLTTAQDDGELRIDVDLGATHQRIIRRFHAVEGSTLVVPLLDADAR